MLRGIMTQVLFNKIKNDNKTATQLEVIYPLEGKASANESMANSKHM